MKSLFSSSTKRSTAFALLLVWLFALASGVANACLIQKPVLHDHRSLVGHSSLAEKGHVVSAVQVGAIFKHDAGLDVSKSQCLKVCADGSQSLTKHHAGFDWTHPVLAPLLAVAWTATPAVSTLGLAAFQQSPDARLPIRIRLSRLTL